MYQQLILILTITTISLASFADQKKDISEEYKNFRKIEDTFFAADINKKNFKAKMTALMSELTASYEKVKKFEASSSEVMLSMEGNQMAYDLEMLSPLQDLAKSSINKETCREAQHNNKLNKAEEGDATEVTALIKKICN